MWSCGHVLTSGKDTCPSGGPFFQHQTLFLHILPLPTGTQMWQGTLPKPWTWPQSPRVWQSMKTEGPCNKSVWMCPEPPYKKKSGYPEADVLEKSWNETTWICREKLKGPWLIWPLETGCFWPRHQTVWKNSLRDDPSPVISGCNIRRPWARTTWQGLSWTPDSHKPWKIRNDCCCSKPLGSGVICNAARDNPNSLYYNRSALPYMPGL